jgi:hypothetical protein
VPEGIKLGACDPARSSTGLDNEHALPRQTRTAGLDLFDIDIPFGAHAPQDNVTSDDLFRALSMLFPILEWHFDQRSANQTSSQERFVN